MFIVFEGPDGAGKTTLMNHYAEVFRQHTTREVILTREPGGTPTSELLRNILKDSSIELTATTELLLIMASRVQHVEELIMPALKRGAVVISDRFHASTMAYQFVGKNVNPTKYLKLHKQFLGPMVPSMEYVITAELDVIEARRSKDANDRFESRPREYHEKLKGFYDKYGPASPARRVVENNGSLEEALEKVGILAEQIAKRIK